MRLPEDILDALKLADDRDQIAYARFLCEIYLADHPDHVTTLIRYACNLIALKQYSMAEKVIDDSQRLVPEERLHHVLAQRGHLLVAKGDFSLAEAAFIRAHELKPDSASHLIYAGDAAFCRGNIERAMELARQAIRCTEGCIEEAYFNLGGYLLSNQQYPEAADCYRKALKIDPDYELAKERLADVELILECQGQTDAELP